jgi:hypothetical protein
VSADKASSFLSCVVQNTKHLLVRSRQGAVGRSGNLLARDRKKILPNTHTSCGTCYKEKEERDGR